MKKPKIIPSHESIVELKSFYHKNLPTVLRMAADYIEQTPHKEWSCPYASLTIDEGVFIFSITSNYTSDTCIEP